METLWIFIRNLRPVCGNFRRLFGYVIGRNIKGASYNIKKDTSGRGASVSYTGAGSRENDRLSSLFLAENGILRLKAG